MDEVLNHVLFNVLNPLLNAGQLKRMLSSNFFVTTTSQYGDIFHPDVFSNVLKENLVKQGLNEQDADKRAKEILSEIMPDVYMNGFHVIDKYIMTVNKKTCLGCPAYKWVIHREGRHRCRLGMEIVESNRNRKLEGYPIEECIRPKNVGASYLIAKELGLPVPMVGKLDKIQYEQLIAEKEDACL